jgi:hypothetical protein
LKEIWLQNEKGELIWIPSPYENLGLVKILPEEEMEETDPEIYEEIDGGIMMAEEIPQPKINSAKIKTNPVSQFSIEKEMRRDLPRLKQRLEESGLSLEDLQNQYSLPNFGQYNVTPSFPSAPQYSRTETPRSANRGSQKMRRMFEE